MNNYLPSSELVIRPASLNDVSIIREIAYKTWPITYGALLGDEQVRYMLGKLYSINVLQEQIENNHHFLIALKDYNPVGFASFSQVESAAYKLQKLYVLPATQKIGAGKALLQAVESACKRKGGKKLLLSVNRKNPAKGFYEKNGFAVERQEDIDIGQGYFMNDYVMQKAL